MNPFAKFIAIAFTLLAIVAMALPYIIPLEVYKAKITEQAEDITGRKLSLNGELRVTLFPSIGVKMQQVTLSNPEGFEEDHIVQLETLTAKLKLLPLLQQNVVFDSLLLEKPRIFLEVNKQGAPNWLFTPTSLPDDTSSDSASKESIFNDVHFFSTAQAEEKAPHTEAKNFAKDLLHTLNKHRIGLVTIHGGEIYYKDAQKDNVMAITQMNLTASLIDSDSPLMIDTEFVAYAQPIKLKYVLNTPKTLLNDGKASTTLKAHIKDSFAEFQGDVTQPEALQLTGKVTVESPSVIQLMAAFSTPPTWQNKPPLKTKIAGNLTCEIDVCRINKGNYAIDAIKAQGELGVLFDKEKPFLFATLTSPAIDLTPYYPKPLPTSPDAQSYNTGHIISSAQAANQERWNRTPYNFSALQHINSLSTISAKSLTLPHFNATDVLLITELTDGTLDMDINKATVFNGHVSGQVILDSAATPARLQKIFTLKDIKLPSIITTTRGSQNNPVRGVLNTSVELLMRGNSEKEFVSSLKGKGTIGLTEGSVEGIDIPQMARNVSAAFSADDPNSLTRFNTLTASMTANNGVISTQNLRVESDSYALDGNGSANLISWQLDAILLPTFLQSSNESIIVPINVSGSLDKPTFKPDLGATIRNAVKNPKATKETIKHLKEDFKDFNSIDDLKEKGILKKGLKGLLGN